MLKKTVGVLLFLMILTVPCPAKSAEPIYPISGSPAKKIFLGEKLKFEVSYLGVTVGDAAADVKEIVKVNGRDAYHIVVEVRSRGILDWVYKVRDTHHSYVDVEYLHSLRYEKKIHEGSYWTDESMEYDQEKHLGKFRSRKDRSQKEMFIPLHVQDQLCCAYWLRAQDTRPDLKVMIPVNADEKNWDLEVIMHDVKEMTLKGVGTFQTVEVEPIVMFEGFFVRRGKIRGWMSLDEHRLPLLMKVKVPVLGDVTATLVQYEPGQGS